MIPLGTCVKATGGAEGAGGGEFFVFGSVFHMLHALGACGRRGLGTLRDGEGLGRNRDSKLPLLIFPQRQLEATKSN